MPLTLKKTLFVAIASIFLAKNAYAYELSEYLKVRESTSAMKNKKSPNPASLQYVNPDNGKSKYKTHLGIKYANPNMKKLDSPSDSNWLKFHQPSFNMNIAHDTLSEKPQDWYSIGYGYLWDIVSKTEDNGYSFSTSLNYKYDKEKDIKTAAFVIGATTIKAFSLEFDNTTPIFSSSIWDYNYPQINFGYEDTIDAPNAANNEGHTTRAWLTETYKLYPLYGSIKTRLELSYTGEFGKDFSPTGVFDNEDETWVINKGSVNWYLSCDKTLAIGWDYANGEDRRKGKENDKTSGVYLKFHWPADKGSNFCTT